MPSLEHQGLALLLLESPRLLTWLLRNVLGLELADPFELQPGPETIRDLVLPDHHADGVIMTTGDGPHAEREAFVTEIQLRKDDDKRWTWALYVGGTAARLRCPTTLVVVTSSTAVERWCATPIDIGRGRLVLRPLVLGPSNVPREVDPALVRTLPELAVFILVIHHRQSGSKRTTRAALDAVAILEHTDTHRARLYRGLVSAFADEEILTMVTQEMRDDLQRKLDAFVIERLVRIAKRKIRREARDAGRQQGRVEALRVVLASRGLHPTAEQHAVITTCSDDATLDRWLHHASRVADVQQLLDHSPPPPPAG